MKASLSTLRRALSKAMGRFPAALSCFLITGICGIVALHREVSGAALFLMIYLPGGAALLNTVLPLALEGYCSRRRLIITLISNLVWAGISLLFYSSYPLGTPEAISAVALAAGLAIMIFLSSPSGPGDDLGFWSHCADCLKALFAAAICGALLTGGACLLLLAMQTLFKLDISENIYLDMLIAGASLGAPSVFLYMLPSSQDRQRHRLGKRARTLLGKICIPLLGAYLAILYVYAVRILVRFELPDGWVSVPVAISMALMLITVILLYPAGLEKDCRMYERFTLGRLPLLFIPLLVLMSIGLGRRIGDYGLTVERVYAVALNLWCYAACITLWLTGSRRIKWIPVSFLALLLLTSALPVNVASLTARRLESQVKESIRRIDPDAALPLDLEEYRHILESNDFPSVLRIEDKLDYLFETYGRMGVSAIVDNSVEYSAIGEKARELRADGTVHQERGGKASRQTVAIPEGSDSVTAVDIFCHMPYSDTLTLNGPVHCSIAVSLADEIKDGEPVEVSCEEGLLVITGLTVNSYGEGEDMWAELHGLLFSMDE